MRVIISSLLAFSVSLSATASVLAAGEPVDANQQIASSADAAASDSGTDASADAYPRVTALENAILNRTYCNDNLDSRLCRMETRAFGKGSTSDDFGDRTDALQTYAETKLHKRLFQPDADSDNAMDDPGAGGPPVSYADDQAGGTADGGYSDSGSQSDYPHVTELENAILGQSYTKDALDARLGRMETKAFGTISKNPDLSERTDALEKYAEKTLHKKPFVQQEAAEAGYEGSDDPNVQQGKRGGKFLSMVGNSLMNMAGVNPAALNSPGMMSPNMMGMGAGSMALGPGMGIGPFGGIRVRPRSAVQQEEQGGDEKPEVVEDPAVRAPNPPPPSAKLITKVGWCEMQVFGRTFANMHLTKRLLQLNDELSFDPGKTGVDLMDAIAPMMKAVENKKAKNQSIGSSAPPAVQ